MYRKNFFQPLPEPDLNVDAAKVDSLVLIPTYNEKENIAAVIDAVMRLPRSFNLLVIDDGSPDGTAAIVREKM